ncbi:MAG: caspase family protein [Rhizobiaceae bacterium]|nr:caspase family protein [Rhizobiaceae bacterium]
MIPAPASHDTKARPLAALARVLAALAIGLWAAAAPARAEEPPSLNGVALVIGQSKYQHIAALPNPANDARDMVGLLSDLGFDARSVTDRDAAKLKRDLERFVEDAEGADVAFLYYSGHGIESGGDNWLIPVDADVSSLDNASETLVSLTAVMDELKATVPVAIVLLDACRTNPFPDGALVRKDATDPGSPVGTSGLVPTRGAATLKQAPAATENLGTVIGFAAEPGRPALDGAAGENSPYASALLRHLGAMNGAEFGAVMRMVTEEVYLDTKTEQRPWVNESLRRLLYFGVAQEAPVGEDALITGERRKLLLTISDLPDASRQQVELVAAKDAVPLDAVYGVLRALGEEKNIPEDPNELSQVLDAQADRLKKMMEQRQALRTDDPDILRLTAAADRAIEQGAIVTAKLFLDDAIGRIEENMSAVDTAEEEVKQKRIADAAVYAKRADASMLTFQFKDAANDYRKAFELIERWDDKLRWNYKNLEAEALNAHGDATGDLSALRQAIEAYDLIVSFLPPNDRSRDWAITRNNQAVVLQTVGEREVDTATLKMALETFREVLAVFVAEKDDANAAAAQNNIGNVLLEIGRRESGTETLKQAVEAFRAALAMRDRDKVPEEWASSQNNIAISLYTLGEREAEAATLVEAEAAYRAALGVLTRAAHPKAWAMTMNNLGNTLVTLGVNLNDRAKVDEAVTVFTDAMTVRTRAQFPMDWASSQLNIGNAFSALGRFEPGTASIEKAAEAYNQALTVFTRRELPMEWASVQNNLGIVLQTLGQRSMDAGKLKESVAAFELAERVYTRRALPLDWATTEHNIGNSLQLIGTLTDDPRVMKDAIRAFENALRVIRREDNERTWAYVQAAIGSVRQTLATHEDMTENLEKSAAARRLALEVITMENAPIEWAQAQNGLGMTLLNLTNFNPPANHLAEARTAFEAAGKVFTRETQPLQWAFTLNNIGDVHWSMATRGGGRPDYEQALALYEESKDGFKEAGNFMLIGLVDQKINLIKDVLAKAE